MKHSFILSKGERRGMVMLLITLGTALVLKSLPSPSGPPVVVYTLVDSVVQSIDTLKRQQAQQVVGPTRASNSRRSERSKSTLVDVNHADSAALQALWGIGPVLASRTVRYRSRLGGFVRLEQMLEVYGVDSQLLVKNKDRIQFQPEVTDSLYINTATFKTVLRHPYFDFQDTKTVFNYIRQHGGIHTKQEFKSIHGLSERCRAFVAPYLSYQGL